MIVESDQVVDISSGKPVIIDKPAITLNGGTSITTEPKTEEKKEEPSKAEVKKEETTTAPPASTEAKKEETPTEPPKTELETKVPPKEVPAKEEVKTPDFAAYLKEKYEIDSEEDLSKILKYNETVKGELEAEKKKEPVYKTDKEKKIAEFLKPYDLDRLSEGLENASTLVGMDIEKIDERRALEEAYILRNIDLTREEAKKLYAKEYRQKYDVKEESFEEKKDFEEEKELIAIQKKKDVAEARRFLNGKKEELKFKEPEKPKEEPKKDIEIPKETIGGYSSQIHKIFDSKEKPFDRMEFQADEKDATQKVNVVFSKDQLKQLKEASVDYLRFPGIYDANKKIPNFEPLAHVRTVANALFGDYIHEQGIRAAFTLGKSLRAEQLAGVKPDKESKGQGEEGIPSEIEQFRRLAEEKKKKAAKV